MAHHDTPEIPDAFPDSLEAIERATRGIMNGLPAELKADPAVTHQVECEVRALLSRAYAITGSVRQINVPDHPELDGVLGVIAMAIVGYHEKAVRPAIYLLVAEIATLRAHLGLTLALHKRLGG